MNERRYDRINSAAIIAADVIVLLIIGGCLLAIAICAVALVRG